MSKPLKALFLTRYSQQGGSSRYMTYDYQEYYQAEGIECTISPLFDKQYFDWDLISGPTHFSSIFKHWPYFAKQVVQRLGTLLDAKQYDLVVLEKEVLPYVPFGLEAFLKHQQVNLIVMYDDAIHAYYDQHPSALIRRLCRAKIEHVIQAARHVIVWNPKLAQYARQHNAHVSMVLHGMDLRRYHTPKHYDLNKTTKPIQLGWMGTPNSFQYIHMLEPVFEQLAQTHSFELIVVSSKPYSSPHIPVHNKPWHRDTEIVELGSFDIGIMPLPDNEWTQGKSGVKALQYMATGLPVVCSPVGINTVIIEHGENGFLANTPQEWHDALDQLIKDYALCARQGHAGRQLVETRHSQAKTAEKLVQILRSVVQ